MGAAGVVAIGRNEGERLRACLASLAKAGLPLVYVDSGSHDASVALAMSMGALAVELDPSRPFGAARARNEGFAALLGAHPGLDYVQFVDADCEVREGWLELATAQLDQRPDAAAVAGRRRERFPDASIYNRICDLEWDTPVGEAAACGGDAMMRVAAFRQVGGFEPRLIAGEEPELCHRLRKAGWKIYRLDAEMTLHDAALLHFRQWWRRSIRSGYGSYDAWATFGVVRYRRLVRSARLWGLGCPLLLLLALALGGTVGVALGACIAVALLAALAVQAVRIGWKKRKEDTTFSVALAYGALMMLAKGAQLIGQAQCMLAHWRQREAVLIEYKTHHG